MTTTSMRVTELSKLALPPGDLTDRDVRAVVDEFRRLLRDARGAQDAVAAAERKLEAAEAADVEALARAKRAGKPDPGRRGVEKAERELEAVRRDADAAVLAAAGAFDDVAAVVEERRDKLVAEAREREAAARAKFGEAVLAVDEAYLDVRDAQAARAWAEGFPGRTKPPGSLRLPGLTAANGDDYHVDAALAALRELAADPNEERAAA